MKTRLLQHTITISVILALAAWGQSDELSDLKERLAIVEQRLDRVEQRLGRHCNDEFEQALDYATTDDFGYATAAPELWDGTPFIVDISSSFPNADALLDVVANEAEKIRTTLGYEIFVAGDVLPLEDATDFVSGASGGTQTLTVEEFRQFLPPDQHIEIRCCDTRPGKSGWAVASLRLAVLINDAVKSNHIILHELYHLFGFTHPGASPGVEMSEFLMWGGFYVNGVHMKGVTPTRGTYEDDLVKLGCIYN